MPDPIRRLIRWVARLHTPRPAARDNPHPWGYDTMPRAPHDDRDGEPDPDHARPCEGRGCTRVGTEVDGVRFDPGYGKWLCPNCWVSVPPPGPRPKNGGRIGRYL